MYVFVGEVPVGSLDGGLSEGSVEEERNGEDSEGEENRSRFVLYTWFLGPGRFYHIMCFYVLDMFSCLLSSGLGEVRVNWCPAGLEIGSYRVRAPCRT